MYVFSKSNTLVKFICFTTLLLPSLLAINLTTLAVVLPFKFNIPYAIGCKISPALAKSCFPVWGVCWSVVLFLVGVATWALGLLLIIFVLTLVSVCLICSTSFCRLAKEVGVSSVDVTLLVTLLLLLSIFCATLSVQPVISPIPKINIPVVFRSLFIVSTFFLYNFFIFILYILKLQKTTFYYKYITFVLQIYSKNVTIVWFLESV